MQATARLQVSFTGPTNVGTAVAMAATLAYVGSAAGFIDIPKTTVTATTYQVPFGSIASGKVAAIQNNTGQDLHVSVNGSEDVFTVPPGGVCMPSCGEAAGITALSVTTTATMTEDGTVSYLVLGDTATP